MLLNNSVLKKRLKYQGRQYESVARGGSGEKNIMTQAAERIEYLEITLNNLLNDCINFDEGNLTKLFQKKATDALKDTATPPPNR